MSAEVGTPVQRGVGYETHVGLRFWASPPRQITVSGTLSPDVSGTFLPAGTFNGKTLYNKTGTYSGSETGLAPDEAGEFLYYNSSALTWRIYKSDGVEEAWSWSSTGSVDGPELATGWTANGLATGTPVVAAVSELVPVASTFVLRSVDVGTETEGHDGAIDNFGVDGCKLVCSGDFKVRSGSTAPSKGDLLYTADHEETTWVVSGDPEVKGFAAGKPFLVTLELMTFDELT